MKHTCIDEETLIDYMERRLSQAAISEIEPHLSECERCRERLILQNRFNSNETLADDAHPVLESVPRRVTERAIQSVLSLEKKPVLIRSAGFAVRFLSELKESLNTMFGMPLPAAVAVRGDEDKCEGDCIYITRTIASFEVKIKIEKRADNSADLSIALSPVNTKEAPVRATLSLNDRELSSALLRSGDVRFENVPFGNCTLLFTRANEIIGEYRFEIVHTDQDNSGT